MSELVAIAYPDVNRAKQVLATLAELQDASLLDLEDACYVTKDGKGKVKLHQAYDQAGTRTGSGAVFGGMMGLMLGALVLMPIAGLAVGAGVGGGAGAVVGHFSDYGIDDHFIKELGAALQPNTSAIIALVTRSTPDKVLPQVGKYGGKILRTSLTDETATRLQAALNQGTAARAIGDAMRARSEAEADQA